MTNRWVAVASVIWYLTNTPLLRAMWAFDATIYYRGSRAWLEGGDPWAASAKLFANDIDFHYAALPTTTIGLAPLTILPEQAATWLMVGLSLLAAIATVRLLERSVLWVLWPPLLIAWAAGNPTTWVMALLVWRRADFLAVLVKAHAVIPMLGELRLRSLAVAAALTLLTVAIAPALWWSYLGRAGEITSRIATESNKGPLVLTAIGIGVMAVLALRDRRRAGWLAIPTIWPQTHYAVFGLPVMTPLYAVLVLLPISYATTIAGIVVGLMTLWRLGPEQRDPELGRAVALRVHVE